MHVILLKDVEKVGYRGDVVSVARGFARNFLFPRRLAEEATEARVAELHKRESQRAYHEAKTADQAQSIGETLTKTVLRFEVKAGPTGSLFGSVTPTDIADEIWRTRKIRIDRRKIGVDPIKRIGRYDVPIDVFDGVRVEVKTLVAPEGGELPTDEELEAMAADEAAASGRGPSSRRRHRRPRPSSCRTRSTRSSLPRRRRSPSRTGAPTLTRRCATSRRATSRRATSRRATSRPAASSDRSGASCARAAGHRTGDPQRRPPPVDGGANFPQGAGLLSTEAPSDARGMMPVSPANAMKRHVHN